MIWEIYINTLRVHFYIPRFFGKAKNFMGDAARTLFGTMKHFFIILGLLKGSKMQRVERESYRYCCTYVSFNAKCFCNKFHMCSLYYIIASSGVLDPPRSMLFGKLGTLYPSASWLSRGRIFDLTHT